MDVCPCRLGYQLLEFLAHSINPFSSVDEGPPSNSPSRPLKLPAHLVGDKWWQQVEEFLGLVYPIVGRRRGGVRGDLGLKAAFVPGLNHKEGTDLGRAAGYVDGVLKVGVCVGGCGRTNESAVKK